MKNKLKAAAAAVTAFAMLGGALPVNFAGVELLRPAVTANAACGNGKCGRMLYV